MILINVYISDNLNKNNSLVIFLTITLVKCLNGMEIEKMEQDYLFVIPFAVLWKGFKLCHFLGFMAYFRHNSVQRQTHRHFPGGSAPADVQTCSSQQHVSDRH